MKTLQKEKAPGAFQRPEAKERGGQPAHVLMGDCPVGNDVGGDERFSRFASSLAGMFRAMRRELVREGRVSR